MPRISKLIGTFTSQEVSTLFKKAKRMRIHPGFDILCAPSDKDFGNILVITAGRIGKAHKRNLIRRRIKAIFYEQGLYKHRIDVIVIVKKQGLELPFEQLTLLLKKTMSLAGKKNG